MPDTVRRVGHAVALLAGACLAVAVSAADCHALRGVTVDAVLDTPARCVTEATAAVEPGRLAEVRIEFTPSG